MPTQIKEWTKLIVRESFFKHLVKKDLGELDTNHALLDVLFPEERRIASIMGGLQTSLGTQLWEKLAKKIASENGFTVKDAKEIKKPQTAPPELLEIISRCQMQREVAGAKITLDAFILELKATFPTPSTATFTALTKGSGVDILLEKDGVEYAFDIKTVQINAGGGTKFNDTLMKWYAYRIFQMGGVINLRAQLIFPYNPYIGADWWAAQAGRAHPLDQKDVLVGEEFWDFLSGETGTWQKILDAFGELEKAGFAELYKEAFHLPSKSFRARILADRIDCTLLTADDNATAERFASNRAPLDWKCGRCDASFMGSINSLKRERAACPECGRILNPTPCT